MFVSPSLITNVCTMNELVSIPPIIVISKVEPPAHASPPPASGAGLIVKLIVPAEYPATFCVALIIVTLSGTTTVVTKSFAISVIIKSVPPPPISPFAIVIVSPIA